MSGHVLAAKYTAWPSPGAEPVSGAGEVLGTAHAVKGRLPWSLHQALLVLSLWLPGTQRRLHLLFDGGLRNKNYHRGPRRVCVRRCIYTSNKQNTRADPGRPPLPSELIRGKISQWEYDGACKPEKQLLRTHSVMVPMAGARAKHPRSVLPG